MYSQHPFAANRWLQLSALLLSASCLWLFRCIFVVAVDLKWAISDWTSIEQSVQKILYPILDFWVSATVLGLVTFILRHPAWSDPAVIVAPDGSSEPNPQAQAQPQVVFVAAPGYYAHPQYGLQQYPPMQMCQQGAQHPQMYPQFYPVQPVMYTQVPPDLSPNPVPANRTHDADTTDQRAPEPQGPQAAQAAQPEK
jgi:hypothetical protein